MKPIASTLLDVFWRVGLVIGLAIGIGYLVAAALLMTTRLDRSDTTVAAMGVAVILLAAFDWTAVVYLTRSALRHPEGNELRARLSQFILNAIGATLLSVYAATIVVRDATGTFILPRGVIFTITIAALLLFSAQSVAFVVRVMRP